MAQVPEILSSAARVAVIRALDASFEPLGVRELARLSQASLGSVQRALAGLSDDGVVTVCQGRRWRLCNEHPLVPTLRAMMQAWRRAAQEQEARRWAARARQVLILFDDVAAFLGHA